jgi:hypothetical protein
MQQLVVIPMTKEGSTDEAVVESIVEKMDKVLDVYQEKLSKNKYLGGDPFTVTPSAISPLFGACCWEGPSPCLQKTYECIVWETVFCNI